jgi:hypothetical protein
MAVVVGGDMASSVSVIVDDECALDWPRWALMRANDGGGGSSWAVGWWWWVEEI